VTALDLVLVAAKAPPWSPWAAAALFAAGVFIGATASDDDAARLVRWSWRGFIACAVAALLLAAFLRVR
jgi:hypothetical protein